MKKTANRNNQRFAICRRGYDIDAVESYIALEQAKANEVQMEQKERIVALKTQCAELNNELASLRAREEQIKSTLVSATDKAEKMTADIKMRYAAELERLRLFRAKWTAAYEQMKDRYHFDKDALNMESVAISTELELRKFLSQDFSLEKGDTIDDMEAHFKQEVNRLSELSKSGNTRNTDSAPIVSGVNELKEKLREAGEKKMKQTVKKINLGTEPAAAFSIEEALHPKESLAEICQYLGLNG